LAGVVLAVTGAEALYADMGHFGRKAITRAWLFVVVPALILNYLGQGALLITDKTTLSAPFFLLTPGWARLPMVLLATAATVIASQAVITGAFSLASQAVQLGYLPRLRVVHTSASAYGQVYMPWINGMLMVAVLILVFAFRSSASLAYAYGMIAVTTFIIMTTWQRGSAIVTGRRETAEGPLQGFVDQLSRRRGLLRVPRTAVFLSPCNTAAPLALRANVKHNHVLHEHVVIVTIDTLSIPRVADSERIEIDPRGDAHDGIIHVTARFGYMETPDVRSVLRLLDPEKTEGLIAIDDA
jgi:KUP system potassium uptake protein